MDSMIFFTEICRKLASSKAFQNFVSSQEKVFEETLLQDKDQEEAYKSLGFDILSSFVNNIISEDIFSPIKHIFNLLSSKKWFQIV